MSGLYPTLLRALGYGNGDKVYVRALVPKGTPLIEALKWGMAWRTPEGKLAPIPIDGYLTLGANSCSFTRLKRVNKDSTQWAETRTYQDGLEQLRELNNQGYGIYYIPNAGGRENQDITRCGSLFYECDNLGKAEQWQKVDELREIGFEPSIVVETRASLHVYFLTQEQDPEGWQQLQCRLIQRQDSDPSIRNRARLMRLAGYNHHAWDKEANKFKQPVPVTLEVCSGAAYSRAQFDELLPEYDAERWDPKHSNSERQASEASHDPWDIRNFAPYLEAGTARRGWNSYKCPAHNGQSNDSLHIEETTGAFKCHGGCDSKAVYDAAKQAAIAGGYQLPKGGKRKSKFTLPTAEKLTADFVGEERYISTLMDRALSEGLTEGKKLIVVASPHNSGKTWWLKNAFFRSYQDRHIPIWALTYRQSLERLYGQLLGIPTRSETRQYRDSIAVTGMTMCVHSMHPDSLARFDGETAPLGPVSLDEVRGVLQELVDSTLVKRAKVLPHFTAHLRRCLAAGYPIVALDAGVTDAEVTLLMRLLGLRRDQVLVVENRFQPWQGKQVYSVGEPAAGVIELKRYLRKETARSSGIEISIEIESLSPEPSLPIWITTSGQQPKSRYGSQTLENVCLSINKKLRILRLDSETAHTSNHPAAKLTVLLESGADLVNEFLKQWDVVIISPVIESGISIELYGHFRAQFSFISGGLTAEAAVQQMLRLRDPNVPIYLACPETGMGCCLKRGNGSPEMEKLRDGEIQRQKGNLHQLLVPTLEGGVDPSFVEYWLAVAARFNGSIAVYQELLKHHLTRVGCTLSPLQRTSAEQTFLAENLTCQKEELAGIAVDQAAHRATELAQAPDLNIVEYEMLKEARYRTPEQARALQRYELRSRYLGMQVIDDTLPRVDMDKPQLKPQVMLEFYLGIGRACLKPNEQQKLDLMAKEGPVFGPDANRRLIGYKVHTFELLGIADLIKDRGTQVTDTDPVIQSISDRLTKFSHSINTTLGIELDQKKSVVWKINYLCRKLLGRTLLVYVGTRGARDERRLKVYEVIDAAQAPEFEPRSDNDHYPQLTEPPEVLSCRNQFLAHLAQVNLLEPASV